MHKDLDEVVLDENTHVHRLVGLEIHTQFAPALARCIHQAKHLTSEHDLTEGSDADTSLTWAFRHGESELCRQATPGTALRLPWQSFERLLELIGQTRAQVAIRQGIDLTRQGKMAAPGLLAGSGGFEGNPAEQDGRVAIEGDLRCAEVLTIELACGFVIPRA